eukprot:TRINITY_DN6851_c0_g1_i1.p1 TRINITY_DN6851_c0_g1~~TRINITY_DN6851_c0_g1_i1.p1  ORF type:complete len:201 (+),score=106.55 TRINITY_DN6851_c0_g1_i1:26-628(+)
MLDEEEDGAIVAKLVLLGEADVGKSSLVLRFVKDRFNERHETTIGAAFLAKRVQIGPTLIKFEIWDTAGAERYHSLAPMYYRDAHAAIVVFDITTQDSYSKSKKWISELRKVNENIVIAFVGNKIDLQTREVTTSEAQSFADSNNITYIETSAKSNTNVTELFNSIAKKIPALRLKSASRLQSAILTNTQEPAQRSNDCC